MTAAKKQTTEVLSTGKILVWDIETSDFKANFGHMLMWSAKFVGEDHVYYSRIDDNKGYGKTPHSFLDDRRMLEELVPLLDEADALVHHYGGRFDLRFVNTRCLEHGMLPPLPPTTIDTWKVARSHLAMTSNRLGVLAESFGGDNQKGGLSKEQWKLAVHGHKPTLDAMLQYCIEDVLATEAVYLKLRPVITNHPYIGPVAAVGDTRRKQCPACGTMHTTGNGVRRTKLYEVYRQRCCNCGTAFESHRVKIK